MFNQIKKMPNWALIAAGLGVAYLILRPNKAGLAVGETVGGVIFEGIGGLVEGLSSAAGNKLSPTSKNNFIYDDIVNGFGRGATGNRDWDLGTAIYDLFN